MAEVDTIDVADATATTRTVASLSLALRTEDAAAEANPRAIPIMGVRRDTLVTNEVSAENDYVAIKADNRGALHVAVAATPLSIAKAEDVASADGDVGVPAMAVQQSTPADTGGTNGDYAMLQMSAGRLWASTIVPAGATTIAKAEDVASANADVGVPAMAIQLATPADTAGTDADYAMLQMSGGRLWVSSPPAAATSIGKAEDVASADADVGVPAMAVRKATPANTSGTDGDYEMLQMSAGRLWTSTLVPAAALSIAKTEDAASADADVGAACLAVQKATPADTAGTDGDYEFLQIKSGRLWVSSPPAAATSIGKAEDVASADADVGVPAMAVRKATPANTSGTDGDYEMLQMSAGRLWASVVTEGPSFTTVWGLSGAPVASADMSSVASVTDAPTSTQKIVVDKIHASVGTTMTLTFKCQTSGAVISGPHYMLANTSIELNFTGPGSKGPKLATADKTLQCIASVSGNVAINVAYHSEA